MALTPIHSIDISPHETCPLPARQRDWHNCFFFWFSCGKICTVSSWSQRAVLWHLNLRSHWIIASCPTFYAHWDLVGIAMIRTSRNCDHRGWTICVGASVARTSGPRRHDRFARLERTQNSGKYDPFPRWKTVAKCLVHPPQSFVSPRSVTHCVSDVRESW